MNAQNTDRDGDGDVSTGSAGSFAIAPLTAETWDMFERLCERHNGIFGGCWCTYFLTMPSEKTFTFEGNKELKKQRVFEDRTHTSLQLLTPQWALAQIDRLCM
ncbi:hypothetical protein [Microbacterium sp. MPKO10]|uniref:hypothetical protein n=1 Tax=Microbacterium sp. MPKO10 TaxID=2989818 RepID=UPI0022363A34|nr:hypothetical protein [Microbacterium sp. MPKO10]MCW4459085.1 hypothetical protein [Microbacterium sp. MPKO10]